MQKINDLQKILLRENELKYTKMFERELAAAACRWKNHSYAASCSVSDRVLFQCLNDYPYIEKVYLCLDSDEPGQTAADRISTKLFALGIESEILVPIHKDWNEDRQAAGGNSPLISITLTASNQKLSVTVSTVRLVGQQNLKYEKFIVIFHLRLRNGVSRL